MAIRTFEQLQADLLNFIQTGRKNTAAHVRGMFTNLMDSVNDWLGKKQDTHFTPTNPGFWTGLVQNGKVSVVDALNFLSQAQQLPVFSLTTTQTNVSTFGGNNGSITATGTGGSGSYQYRIDGGAWSTAKTTSHTFSNLTAGAKTVEVRDANDTTKTATTTVTLTQPAMTLASATLTVSSSSVQAGEPITLTYGENAGNETISYREMQISTFSNGSWGAWEMLVPGQTGSTWSSAGGQYVVNTDAGLPGDVRFRYRITSESGEKLSPVRTVTVVASVVWDNVKTVDSDAGTAFLAEEHDAANALSIYHVAGTVATVRYMNKASNPSSTGLYMGIFAGATQILHIDYTSDHTTPTVQTLEIEYGGVKYTKQFLTSSGNITL